MSSEGCLHMQEALESRGIRRDSSPQRLDVIAVRTDMLEPTEGLETMGGRVYGRSRNVGGEAKWSPETSEQVEGAHPPFAEHVVTHLIRSRLQFPS
jgi:hypothetical protein